MTEEPISKSELGNHLLGACDILRGPINQDEYKSYITPLLFFKRISDVYDEETTEALEMSDGDEDYAALPENHSFAVPDGLPLAGRAQHRRKRRQGNRRRHGRNRTSQPRYPQRPLQ